MPSSRRANGALPLLFEASCRGKRNLQLRRPAIRRQSILFGPFEFPIDAFRITRRLTPMSQAEGRFQPNTSFKQNAKTAPIVGRRFTWSLAFITALSVLISLQAAMAAAPSAAVKETCGAEIRSVCLRPWRLTPDAISACVEENSSKLSPVCQAFWVTASMCQSEMRDVCGGLNPFTIKSCLKNRKQAFSQVCQETLSAE